MPTAPTHLDELISTVTETFHSTFSRIDSWRQSVSSFADSQGGNVASSSLDTFMESLVRHEFDRVGALVVGAGFVADPQFLTDAQWHLAWWLGTNNTFESRGRTLEVRRLEAEEDPLADNFRDYTTLEWWRVPERTGEPHITGPYVDYLCTDEYTLTLTSPVLWRGRFIGVVGADLYAHDIERILLPKLKALGASGTLVNASGRVVVSLDPHRPTGSLHRTPGLSEALRACSVEASPETRDWHTLASGHTVIACTDTSLSLVIDPVL
jgi:hypothetical protein